MSTCTRLSTCCCLNIIVLLHVSLVLARCWPPDCNSEPNFSCFECPQYINIVTFKKLQFYVHTSSSCVCVYDTGGLAQTALLHQPWFCEKLVKCKPMPWNVHQEALHTAICHSHTLSKCGFPNSVHWYSRNLSRLASSEKELLSFDFVTCTSQKSSYCSTLVVRIWVDWHIFLRKIIGVLTAASSSNSFH